MRSLGALVADVLVVVVFVAVGLTQHGQPLTSTTISLVAWPFVVGLLLGHLAIRSWRRPFALWPQGVFVWAITIVAAMAIRTLFGAGTELSFVLVTAAVLGVLMLGWRAIASWVTRHERREVLSEADVLGEADEAGVADERGSADAPDTRSASAGRSPSDAVDEPESGTAADRSRPSDRFSPSDEPSPSDPAPETSPGAPRQD